MLSSSTTLSQCIAFVRGSSFVRRKEEEEETGASFAFAFASSFPPSNRDRRPIRLYKKRRERRGGGRVSLPLPPPPPSLSLFPSLVAILGWLRLSRAAPASHGPNFAELARNATQGEEARQLAKFSFLPPNSLGSFFPALHGAVLRQHATTLSLFHSLAGGGDAAAADVDVVVVVVVGGDHCVAAACGRHTIYSGGREGRGEQENL